MRRLKRGPWLEAQLRCTSGCNLLPMTTEIPPTFLRRLIAIGESPDLSGIRELFVEFPPKSVGHFMRQLPQFWYSIADSLSDAQLEALIRAMTVAERDFPEFGGGSVSGVIWTFRRLEERQGCRHDALADWILAHTANDWAPFDRSMWFRDKHGTAYVVVRSARHPVTEAPRPANLTAIMTSCAPMSRRGFFASVTVGNAGQQTVPASEGALPLYRGHGMVVRFKGLEPLYVQPKT